MKKDAAPASIDDVIVSAEEWPAMQTKARQLALSRAQVVKSYLLDPGRMGAERIFLVEPGTTSPETKEKAESRAKTEESRVDFALK